MAAVYLYHRRRTADHVQHLPHEGRLSGNGYGYAYPGTAEEANTVRYLSDAFLIPGVLLTGVGLLSFIRKQGAYDGLGYTFDTMKRTFTMRRYMDPIEEGSEDRTYFGYKQKVKEKRKVAWHLIIVGCGFLLTAIALAIVHSKTI